MESINCTLLTEFILTGVPHPPRLRTFLFLFFLLIYILTQLGNLLILITVCADTQLHARPMYIFLGVDIGVVVASCFSLILLSYIYIIRAILRIRTADGRQRAFSTCGAHVTMVTVYYVPCAFIYLRPESHSTLDGAAALFPTAITPFLNPLIYTLRNQEVKLALRRMVGGQRTKSKV
nr:olfactory receptor 10G3-like [Meriones unguiculatus]